LLRANKPDIISILLSTQSYSPERRQKLVKGIIFDAYGTLIDTGDGSILAVKEILSKNKREIDAKIFYQRWKYYHKKHIASLKTFIKEEDIFLMDLTALYKEYEIAGNPENDVKIMLNTLGKRNAYPETNLVLDVLRPRYKLFIGSTSDHAPLMNDIKRNGIRVNKVFTSEYLKAYKPQKEFYQQILDEIKMQPEELIFIGDSLADDVSGPASLGIQTIWINRNNLKYDPVEFRPLYEIRTLSQLLEIVI
jgi:2-haloalkanoic acid dehalogenase type II